MPLQDAESNFIGLAPLLIAVGVLLLALVVGYIVPRVRRAHRQRGPIPMVDFGGTADVLPPRPVLRNAPDAESPGAPPPPATRPADAATPPNVNVARTGTDDYAHREPRGTPEAPVLRLETITPEGTGSRSNWRSSPPRAPRASEGTLQFLPGRFEIVEGRDLGQEIRFVRAPGATDVEVTLGRGDGPQYRHVQLHEPTVSRLHARMTLDGRRWQLTNMSRTNPVVVNGAAMEDEGSSHILSDGDRVELGEVVLRFRAR